MGRPVAVTIRLQAKRFVTDGTLVRTVMALSMPTIRFLSVEISD